MSDIDAVFCWVDGGDVNWLKKKEKYFSLKLTSGKYGSMNSDARYQQFGEIYYAIHSLRKYAPWVRHVYLLTDEQTPDWLTRDKQNALGVIMVDHKEVFHGFEKALPTFNSRSIESMLNNIPGLSDRFLYLNDDIVLVAPTTPEDFFYNDGLVVRGRLRFRFKLLDKICRYWERYCHGREGQRDAYVGRLAPDVSVPFRWSYFELGHAPHALYKSDFDKVVDNDFLVRNVYHRFRDKNQVSPISFVLNWSRKFRKVRLNRRDWRCVYSGEIANHGVDALFRAVDRQGVKFICFNDLSLLEQEEVARVHGSLRNRLGL